jgi:hypothetical protein
MIAVNTVNFLEIMEMSAWWFLKYKDFGYDKLEILLGLAQQGLSV